MGLVHECRVQLHNLGQTLIVRRLALQPSELPVPSQGSCNVHQVHTRSCVARAFVGRLDDLTTAFHLFDSHSESDYRTMNAAHTKGEGSTYAVTGVLHTWHRRHAVRRAEHDGFAILTPQALELRHGLRSQFVRSHSPPMLTPTACAPSIVSHLQNGIKR